MKINVLCTLVTIKSVNGMGHPSVDIRLRAIVIFQWCEIAETGVMMFRRSAGGH